MFRSAAMVMISALALFWAGTPQDHTLREHMVPVVMADGHLLHVAPLEVTLADWLMCVRSGGCSFSPKAPVTALPQPVTGVNFFDIQQYLAWANARSGGGLRLPRQDEWRWLNRTLERAKRPPLFTDPRLAWAAHYGEEESPGGPVRKSGSFTTTPDGISDLDGNVWEWTGTCAMPGYGGSAAQLCPAYVVEGAHEAEIPVFLRNPAAGGCATGTPPTYLGFRLVSDN